MFTVLVIFHVIVCAGLILAVLMQSSKGEGLAGSAFGGSFSGAMFGGRGAASFLSKATSVLAVLFMLNCGTLAYMSSSNRPNTVGEPGAPVESVISKQAQREREQMMQQQQQMGDTSAAAKGVSVTPTTPNVTVTPTDTSGK